jgi:hypothetical protein
MEGAQWIHDNEALYTIRSRDKLEVRLTEKYENGILRNEWSKTPETH